MTLGRWKIALWGIALVLCATAMRGGARADEPDATRVRVLSYNIHHAEGTDRKLDLARIAAVIRSAKPDVVALQEVDRNVMRTGNVDQVAELAKLTEMQHVFGGNIKLQGGEYGNAVLTRWPIRRHQNRLLTSTGGEQRGVLEVEIEVPGADEPLVVLGTHLDHRRPDDERFQSAVAINSYEVTQSGQPAILLGDLNDVRGGRTLRELESKWTHTSEQALPTAPSRRPRRQIDFILVRPAERWRTIETRVLEEPVASDHAPLMAVLEVQAK